MWVHVTECHVTPLGVPLGAHAQSEGGVPVVFSGVLTGNEVTRRGSLGCAHAQPEAGISRTFSFYFFLIFFLFFFPLFS
jgi:ABC-type Na+ efflux pump permease subunit